MRLPRLWIAAVLLAGSCAVPFANVTTPPGIERVWIESLGLE